MSPSTQTSLQVNGSKMKRSNDNGDMNFIPSTLSTSALENKLRQLREQSQKDSQILTQKLASSQTGQNLLHIGTSLSTLPPDLHSLLTQLHPVLSAAEQSEAEQLEKLQHLVSAAQDIRLHERMVQHASECANLYADLVAAETCLQTDSPLISSKQKEAASKEKAMTDDQQEEENAALDYAASLERAAHITLCLVEELQAATETVSALTSAKHHHRTTNDNIKASPEGGGLPTIRTPLPEDSERAQFLLQLAPRIRRLEADTIRSLGQTMEGVLKQIQELQANSSSSSRSDEEVENCTAADEQDDLLLIVGHVMRGLAILGRGKEVESIFARVAIMPLIRSKVSMGRLDEGGSRGECAGLVSLLHEIADSIAAAFGPVLRLAESMFDEDCERMDVDCLTAGVWVPIATALMADAGIKMAIFSPGIASILQANYTALDIFLSQLAERLLKDDRKQSETVPLNTTTEATLSTLYFRPSISADRIRQAQNRIYAHPKTAEFSKKWNLPIYYQLRFGECCSRLNKAVDLTKKEGWIAQVFSGSEEQADELKQEAGFELSLFLELYDILLGLWRPDVILRPLTNRFLRGAVQLIGRIVSFVSDGMEGKIMFGDTPEDMNGKLENGDETNGERQQPAFPTRKPYCWSESEIDVAAVAWELTILDSTVRHDYVNTVCQALGSSSSSVSEKAEIRSLVSDVLKEASDQILPIIDKAWNDTIVKILTSKCSAPLSAVKGVAATYRMTNRPPPTQASPFVGHILRPLKEFSSEFANRTPDRVGARWKQQVVVTVADRYASAVEELIATVQRTEAALTSRRARRTAIGGMRDGEKVKLQLYFDYEMFSSNVRALGVEPATVIGLSKLQELTAEGESLLKRKENGS